MVRRRAVTLVELVVAMLVAAVALAVVWRVIVLMTRGEQTIDREGARALVLARLVECLQQDLRSSVSATQNSPKDLKLQRYVDVDHRLQLCNVVWTVEGAALIRRKEDGGASQDFNFSALLSPGTPALTLRLTRMAAADEVFASH